MRFCARGYQLSFRYVCIAVKLDVGTVPHYRKWNLHYWTSAAGHSSHNNRSVIMRMNCRQISTCWVAKVIFIIRLLKVHAVQRYPSDSHNQVFYWPLWLPNLWMYDTAKALLMIAYPTASTVLYAMEMNWSIQFTIRGNTHGYCDADVRVEVCSLLWVS